MSIIDEPTLEQKRSVERVLEDGPLTHDEMLDRVEMTEEEMKRARTALWREDCVVHTLDRRFDLTENMDKTSNPNEDGAGESFLDDRYQDKIEGYGHTTLINLYQSLEHQNEKKKREQERIGEKMSMIREEIDRRGGQVIL